jgi:uncharacterized protein YfaA (DUF2138 family)
MKKKFSDKPVEALLPHENETETKTVTTIKSRSRVAKLFREVVGIALEDYEPGKITTLTATQVVVQIVSYHEKHNLLLPTMSLMAQYVKTILVKTNNPTPTVTNYCRYLEQEGYINPEEE